MTILVDISCPECGQTEPVRKLKIGQYRCTDCELDFTQTDIDLEQ